MVRGVAGRVNDVEFASSERQRFAAFEDAQIFLRDGQGFTEQKLKFITPEAAGAVQEFCGVDHVVGASAVNVNGQARIFTDESASSSSVVEMDMGEQDGVKVGDGDRAGAKLLAQRRESGFGTRVNDSAMIFGFEQCGGDRFPMADPIGIEWCDFVHSVFVAGGGEIGSGLRPSSLTAMDRH